MKKSLLISWISGCDYPIFRQWLDKYHDYFDEIIIYWDIQFRFPFYNAFIQDSLKRYRNIKFLDHVERDYGTTDWRNISTNELVNNATGDWLISIEQDWFCKDWDELFSSMTKSMEQSDMFGWWNETVNPYIHPAFFGIKRELLDKTSKDFSAHPEIDGSDHFATITYDAQKLGAKIDKYGGAFTPDSLCFHLGGVNQNYLNGLAEGFGFHRPEVFMIYNYWCRKSSINGSLKFLDLSLKIEMRLRQDFPDLDLENNPWSKFFKLK